MVTTRMKIYLHILAGSLYITELHILRILGTSYYCPQMEQILSFIGQDTPRNVPSSQPPRSVTRPGVLQETVRSDQWEIFRDLKCTSRIMFPSFCLKVWTYIVGRCFHV